MTSRRRAWLLGALLVLSAGLALTDRSSMPTDVVRPVSRTADAAPDRVVVSDPADADRRASRPPSRYFDEDAFRIPAIQPPAAVEAGPARPVERRSRPPRVPGPEHSTSSPAAAAPTPARAELSPPVPMDTGAVPPVNAFGRFVDDTGVMAFVQIADQTRVVRHGDSIGRDWRIEAITEHELKLVHGPSRKVVAMPLREGR